MTPPPDAPAEQARDELMVTPETGVTYVTMIERLVHALKYARDLIREGIDNPECWQDAIIEEALATLPERFRK